MQLWSAQRMVFCLTTDSIYCHFEKKSMDNWQYNWLMFCDCPVVNLSLAMGLRDLQLSCWQENILDSLTEFLQVSYLGLPAATHPTYSALDSSMAHNLILVSPIATLLDWVPVPNSQQRAPVIQSVQLQLIQILKWASLCLGTYKGNKCLPCLIQPLPSLPILRFVQSFWPVLTNRRLLGFPPQLPTWSWWYGIHFKYVTSWD